MNRQKLVLRPSQSRVLIRPFIPADTERCSRIAGRIQDLAEGDVRALLTEVFEDFGGRHQQLRAILLRHFENVRPLLRAGESVSEDRKLLIGAYFTLEYSLESAALFNPSIVLHPDQSGLSTGSVRFILSLRATGEGHISSIVFRTGTIDRRGEVSIVEPTPFVVGAERTPDVYDKAMFARKLKEMAIGDGQAEQIMAPLPDSFTMPQLDERIAAATPTQPWPPDLKAAVDGMRHLAANNYRVRFRPDQRPSERAIFPASPSQRNGIEDARFVRFVDDDGSVKYYATYTAYDGRLILPQLLETADFLDFSFITLNGPAASNKGMALFPRRVNGCYTMLSRHDSENLFLAYSDNVHFWYSPELLIKPAYPWELVQMGNCGSPIETPHGWLVLSHGVGPMRKYCIGAFLLDKDDPSKVLGRLPQPLLKPGGSEREGYVPNVVYTCGALLHGDVLVIPYAMSDYSTGFASAPLADLINAMV